MDIILANVGTVVCFRSGSPADERLVLPLFSPYISQGEIANLPAYSFYARIAAVHSQEPMSGVTVLLTDNGSDEIARQVIESSRSTHAITFEKQVQTQTQTQQVIKQDDRPKTRRRKEKINQSDKKDQSVSAKTIPLG